MVRLGIEFGTTATEALVHDIDNNCGSDSVLFRLYLSELQSKTNDSRDSPDYRDKEIIKMGKDIGYY